METFFARYHTPDAFSDLFLRSDGEALTGLWFEGSRDSSRHLPLGEEKQLPIFVEAESWLDAYFSGRDPGALPPLKIGQVTPFRREVIDEMLQIPYGSLTTYGDIAAHIAKAHGIEKMSSRAVGGAVGWNPICIMIPCHRVIGASRSLTGYGGGIRNKIALLELEGQDMAGLIVPTRGTAL